MITNMTVYGIGGHDPALPNNNIIFAATVVTAGIGATAETTPATLHFARTESGAHTWTVNGGAYNVAATLDAESGLYWSEVTVQTPTGSASGEEVTVTVDGETLTLRTP
jgi:hypothetical protein